MITLHLVPAATGYYSKGQISYYKDKKEIVPITYKEKEGKFIGTKKILKNIDTVTGGCGNSSSIRTTTCCQFQQTAVK